MGYLLGFDIGSSSIKAALVSIESGKVIGSTFSPATELEIEAPQPGWAEQDPEVWWHHAVQCAKQLGRNHKEAMSRVEAIGISYQMHGLVLVGKDDRPLRPAIIWCDSRAVEIGEKAFKGIGREKALKHLLNSPGNFTASKLAWVKEHEPALYEKAKAALLPGDYIALKLTGETNTTPSGLSEGILWDFQESSLAKIVTSQYGFREDLFPEVVPTFATQGVLTAESARLLGLAPGIPVSYRAGDQPNNAFSLNVLEPGEVATTAGTSGVVYGVGDQNSFDPLSRVNTFLHVNHTPQKPRLGTLLCINGTGILNSWTRKLLSSFLLSSPLTYDAMNQVAADVEPGSDGLLVYPYGNGAERSLGNKTIGASLDGIQLNQHGASHLLRAVQEGIVYSLQYGFEVMRGMGMKPTTVRAGKANMFLSPLFREIFSAVTNTTVELFDTDGAQGAARGAGLGAGIFHSREETFNGLTKLEAVSPQPELVARYRDLYGRWRTELEVKLKYYGALNNKTA